MDEMLYLDGSCGISGDMAVAALMALGADRAPLDAALAPLAAEGLSYTLAPKTVNGLAGWDFDVRLPEHDHHHGEHGHHHEGHAHRHEHRHLADVEALLAALPMTDRARDLALRAFRIVAEAEAKAHGCALGEVHFHEVGALDSIADIVGAATLFDNLGVRDCVVTRLCEGTGTVRCAHGELPVPVPATLNIAQAHAIPLEITDVRGERVTPTGAALAAAFRTRTDLPAPFTVVKTGLGHGKRDLGRVNALRASLIRADDAPEALHVLEANIDDCSGETLAAAAATLLAQGARDVVCLPCLMKKGRPGTLVQVLADEPLLPRLAESLFRETTTIGVRTYPVRRTVMARTPCLLRTPYGEIRAKRCVFGDLVRIYPEADSVRDVAAASGAPFPDVFAAAQCAARTTP